MNKFVVHLRTHVLRGVISTIPIALSLLAVLFLYRQVDQRVLSWIDEHLGLRVPGLGILIVLVVLYLLGLLGSNLVGRQIFALLDRLSRRIPLIRTTYNVGKQLAGALALPERQVFQRVVLVRFYGGDSWTPGFVTGEVICPEHPQGKLLKVFVPTPPNPTSGTLILVPESEVVTPGWSVDDTVRTVVSAGIIGPERMTWRTQKPPL